MSNPVDAHSPLVSILLRSLDRPQLQEALDSVAAQTWARMELIVAPAAPGHTALPKRLGQCEVRLLPTERSWQRSANANRLLDAAGGDLLLFLDDDDWLMPDHVERLVSALRRHPHSSAAYAGVAAVDGDGRPLGQVFDLPWDATRLLCGNLTPIHAVMFRESLRQKACRFDEAIDRYEDWDFWLQVARVTPMVHVPGVSAVYRIHASSGVHQDVDGEGSDRARIHARWLERCTAKQRADLMSRAWSYDDVVHRLNGSEEFHRERIGALEKDRSELQELLRQGQSDQSRLLAQVNLQSVQLEELRQRFGEQQLELRGCVRELEELRQRSAEQAFEAQRVAGDLAAVHASSSWRVTAPLRWLAHCFRRIA